MTKMILTRIAAIAAVVLVFSLAACAPSPKTTAPAKSKPAAMALTTPKVVEGDYDGDGKIGPWDLEQAAKANLAFTLPDGTVVAIPTDKPLPAEVVDALSSRLQSVAAYSNDPNSSIRAYAAFDEVKAETGREIVPVTHGMVRFASSGVSSWGWAVGAPAPGTYGFTTKEAAIAYADEFVAGRTQFQVLVFG